MIRSSLAYLATGLGAVILAVWAATQFMPQAFSQNPVPQVDAVAPPQAELAQAKPSVAPAASPTPSQAGSPKASPQAAKPAETGKEEIPSKATDLLQGIIEDYSYVSEGKRDPFMPLNGLQEIATGTYGPGFPLERFDLDQLKLVGVIWDVRNPKAMILDPTGKSYVIKVNERIGRNRGYVARIREGELVVVESFTGTDGKVTYQTRLVKLIAE